MDLTSDTIQYTIKALIVQAIIGELFFNTEAIEAHIDDEAEEDVASAAFHRIAKLAKQKKYAMLLFKPAELAAEGAASYTVTIKNSMRNHLVIDHVGAGISFNQTALAIGHSKNRAQRPKLAGINDLIVGKFVRVQVAVALQRIADILSNDDQVWAFSWPVTSAHTSDIHSSAYACACTGTAASSTGIWSRSPCSTATPPRTCST